MDKAAKRTLSGSAGASSSRRRRKVKVNDSPARMGSVHLSILTEVSGTSHFKDLTDGVDYDREVDENHWMSQWVGTVLDR